MLSRPGPTYFYYSPKFEGERGKPVPMDYSGADIRLQGASDTICRRYLDLINRVQFERRGVLKGEYACLSGQLLIDRDGMGIAINCDGDDLFLPTQLSDQWESDECRGVVEHTIRNWETFPKAENATVLSEPYVWNYFHHSLLLVPKMRLFSAKAFIMALDSLHTLAMRSLIAKVMGDHQIIPLKGTVRVADPEVAQSSVLRDGVLWLRERAALQTRPAGKRYYLRRSGSSRTGENGKPLQGGIYESEDFLRLLADFGFEAVESSGGDLTYEQQAMKLEGAEVILSPHGAALTNIAYLPTPLSVIEMLPPLTRHLSLGVYMELSAIIGARYRGIITDGLDEEGRQIVNCDVLRDVLNEICAKPAARRKKAAAAA